MSTPIPPEGKDARREPQIPSSPRSAVDNAPNTISSRTRSPLRFFLLVFVLSVPFWLIGAATGLQLLPGLPVSALMVLCPLTAAVLLVYRENKTASLTELLKRSFDYHRIRAKIWYAPSLLLMPGIAVLAYGVMRLMDCRFHLRNSRFWHLS